MIRAALFGPGLPTAGRTVTVTLHASEAQLTDDAGVLWRVRYDGLDVRPGGWDGDTLHLEWQESTGRWSLAVQADALAEVRASAPEALRMRLGRHVAARRAPAYLPLLLAVATLLTVAFAAIALLLVQGDRVVDLAVRRISPEWERRVGTLIADAASTAWAPVPDGPATRTVAEIGARIAAQADAPYVFRFLLVDDPEVNALAAPGGVVIVYAGLVRAARSAEELAGVLAHETAHVVGRDSLRGVVRALGWRAILGLLVWGTGDASALALGVNQLEQLRFSRQQEADADAAGVRLLVRAEIDPRGLATFFERLAGRDGEPPPLFSSHPASIERARTIRELSGAAPTPPALAVDWTAVQASLPGARR